MKNFEKPVLEVKMFNIQDILTASGPADPYAGCDLDRYDQIADGCFLVDCLRNTELPCFDDL